MKLITCTLLLVVSIQSMVIRRQLPVFDRTNRIKAVNAMKDGQFSVSSAITPHPATNSHVNAPATPATPAKAPSSLEVPNFLAEAQKANAIADSLAKIENDQGMVGPKEIEKMSRDAVTNAINEFDWWSTPGSVSVNMNAEETESFSDGKVFIDAEDI
ncbi:hypothetical protein CONCODRAFT_3752 [Conidiobolus coronatus NRRL 28638]|uniref:Uncharacterized protein n=1 Tax=Conidiobolus coronatus (strain ATCC 28846 / CBS 209.66 / NRRL 28638) TaxID=796925 RepID=A0A137PE58_CONC2|nr:hypothetical protein CONCODRAFT_3752 [Conidiobolus coronatus NRRL 28638]|eukprot:KXN73277.1 hypothetical protein CONCODRAFT_3752 [Conidiobolus coronatus NRRL 28638]